MSIWLHSDFSSSYMFPSDNQYVINTLSFLWLSWWSLLILFLLFSIVFPFFLSPNVPFVVVFAFVHFFANFFYYFFYSVFHQFRQAKLANGGSILSSSQFLILSQLPQKMKLVSKVVKIDPKIIVSLPEIEICETHCISTSFYLDLHSWHKSNCLLSRVWTVLGFFYLFICVSSANFPSFFVVVLFMFGLYTKKVFC